jgi:hypothetical protein
MTPVTYFRKVYGFIIIFLRRILQHVYYISKIFNSAIYPGTLQLASRRELPDHLLGGEPPPLSEFNARKLLTSNHS